MNSLLLDDVKRVVGDLDGDGVRPIQTDHLGVVMPAVLAVLKWRIELIFVASDNYPGIPPIILCTQTQTQGNTEQMQIEWNLKLPASDRLLTSLRQHFLGVGIFRECYGSRFGHVFTDDTALAKSLNWRRIFSANPLHTSLDCEALFARSRGILSTSLKSKHVMIIGLGSGGSHVAEQLARSGVMHFTLIDPDEVEQSNLSGASFYIDDIGRTKVDAVKERIVNINPKAQINAIGLDLVSVGKTELKKLFLDSDIILALTDDPIAQAKPICRLEFQPSICKQG